MESLLQESGKMELGIVGGEEMKNFTNFIKYRTSSLITEIKDGDFQ